MPVSALAEGTVMQAEDCVDAALLTGFTDASAKLFGASQTGKPAARYLATA